ncbi:glycosyltransferase [Bdellovibrionota bacterium FG-2]
MRELSPPLVSVCIPAYNCESFIEAALKSVLSQTFQDFEIILVDNCSTDGTLARAKKFESERVHIYKNETNIGAEGNWNRVISHARGRFVKLLCADDVLLPRCLERQVAVFLRDKDGEIALVSCRRQVIDQDGKVLLKAQGLRGMRGQIVGKWVVKKTVRSGRNPLGEPSAVLFRKSLIEKIGGFSAEFPYLIDLDFWFRLLRWGDLYAIPEGLCSFRVTSTSWSSQLVNIQANQTSAFYRSIARHGLFRVSSFDLWMGIVRAHFYAFLRKALYRFWF